VVCFISQHFNFIKIMKNRKKIAKGSIVAATVLGTALALFAPTHEAVATGSCPTGCMDNGNGCYCNVYVSCWRTPGR
jgi:hypothetical protein